MFRSLTLDYFIERIKNSPSLNKNLIIGATLCNGSLIISPRSDNALTYRATLNVNQVFNDNTLN